MLQSLEAREIPKGEVVISIDESDSIKGNNFLKSYIHISVFNTDFVKNSIFSIEPKDIPPIIILGKESKVGTA